MKTLFDRLGFSSLWWAKVGSWQAFAIISILATFFFGVSMADTSTAAAVAFAEAAIVTSVFFLIAITNLIRASRFLGAGAAVFAIATMANFAVYVIGVPQGGSTAVAVMAFLFGLKVTSSVAFFYLGGFAFLIPFIVAWLFVAFNSQGVSRTAIMLSCLLEFVLIFFPMLITFS